MDLGQGEGLDKLRLLALVNGAISPADLQDGLPAYLMLQKTIQAGIETDYWKTGDLIPPERLLAETTGLSIGTVKKALLNLVSEGLLYRVRGRGTFVAGTSVARENRRYYLMLTDFHSPENDLAIHFAGLDKTRANATVARALSIATGSTCHLLRRVFHEHDRPVIYTVSLLPKAQFPKLDAVPVSRLENVPLFIILQEVYGVPTINTDELIGLGRADQEQADALQVEQGAGLLSIESIVYAHGRRPFEYRYSYCLVGEKKIFRAM